MVVRINMVNDTVEHVTSQTAFTNPTSVLWLSNSQSIFVTDAGKHV
jgi:hypothetical protein